MIFNKVKWHSVVSIAASQRIDKVLAVIAEWIFHNVVPYFFVNVFIRVGDIVNVLFDRKFLVNGGIITNYCCALSGHNQTVELFFTCLTSMKKMHVPYDHISARTK